MPTPTPQIVIEPATTVSVSAGTGYFADPYPVLPWISTTNPSTSQSFIGTVANEILTCPGTIQASCFQGQPISVDTTALQAQASANNVMFINGSENQNTYQDPSGNWHMAVTLHVISTTNASAGKWNVIAHAHPVMTNGGIPTQWAADTLLVGSFSQPDNADYDGHYFLDGGRLYFVYTSMISVSPPQNGIVAQLMTSPTQPAPSAPTTLIGPTNDNGGYNSEYASINPSNTFKLLETGFITVIDGKYVMGYSDGSYDLPNYKAALAWSDTFLPPAGSYYIKALKTDTAGVWGQPNHAEVQYILQSYESAWPNYVASQVLAPGVPSLEQDATGQWYLFFAGYAPSDAPPSPTKGSQFYDGSHRRPFFIKVQVNIPAGATVAGTSPYDLVSWIQPVTSE